MLCCSSFAFGTTSSSICSSSSTANSATSCLISFGSVTFTNTRNMALLSNPNEYESPLIFTIGVLLSSAPSLPPLSLFLLLLPPDVTNLLIPIFIPFMGLFTPFTIPSDTLLPSIILFLFLILLVIGIVNDCSPFSSPLIIKLTFPMRIILPERETDKLIGQVCGMNLCLVCFCLLLLLEEALEEEMVVLLDCFDCFDVLELILAADTELLLLIFCPTPTTPLSLTLALLD